MGILIFLAICAAVGYYANKKGRSFFLWSLLAIFISPLIAGVILALVKNKKIAEDISELRMEQEHLRDRISGDEKLNDLRFRKLDEQLGGSRPAQELAAGNQADDRFLDKLADDQIRYCSACGGVLAADDKFCPHCGARVDRSDTKNGQ